MNVHPQMVQCPHHKKEAGFTFVPDPIPMCNSTRSTVYYLFFASQNEVGKRIVEQIFKKFRGKVAKRA